MGFPDERYRAWHRQLAMFRGAVLDSRFVEKRGATMPPEPIAELRRLLELDNCVTLSAEEITWLLDIHVVIGYSRGYWIFTTR
jgi:hypothetical protein